jgi:quinol monooxygenase YgiN
VKAASGAVSTKETIMGELQGIVRFTFHADKVEEFKRLSAECLEIVRTKDVGTLQYDTYFNDDESECIVLERFRDSDALILHGQNMAPLMESIMATGRSAASSSATSARSSGHRWPRARSDCSRCTRRCSSPPASPSNGRIPLEGVQLSEPRERVTAYPLAGRAPPSTRSARTARAALEPAFGDTAVRRCAR